MFGLIAGALAILFLVVAGASLFVANLNSDELNRMGVEKKP